MLNILTTNCRQKSLSLSGGHILVDQLMLPSYSPNAAPTGSHFPWEEDIDEINTPDIDPSFFDADPFKKLSSQSITTTTTTHSSHPSLMDFGMTDAEAEAEDSSLFLSSQTCFAGSEDSSQQSTQQSLDDNVFLDLSQLINQSNPDLNGMSHMSGLEEPNQVTDSHYMPVSSAPVLHYLEPKPVQSIALSIGLDSMTTDSSLIDSIASHSTHQSFDQFSSPSHSSSNSYSPPLSTVAINESYETYLSPTSSPSPALSYTSSSSTITSMSHSKLISDSIGSDIKPEPEFLQPTVINDHLYTRPSTSSSSCSSSSTFTSSSALKRKDKLRSKDKYLNVRSKNNMASKKSRVTKRDKQKLMDEQIQHYIEDNAHCRQMIEQMEREIDWCKNYLFRKVVASAKS